mmetsp:Transcript_44051/g.73396  ORF Transcript_44051/g.73396 Transcript_44051/m.73396 type:complete len:216 (-) Transcript_44051:597-1244(-)
MPAFFTLLNTPNRFSSSLSLFKASARSLSSSCFCFASACTALSSASFCSCSRFARDVAAKILFSFHLDHAFFKQSEARSLFNPSTATLRRSCLNLQCLRMFERLFRLTTRIRNCIATISAFVHASVRFRRRSNLDSGRGGGDILTLRLLPLSVACCFLVFLNVLSRSCRAGGTCLCKLLRLSASYPIFRDKLLFAETTLLRLLRCNDAFLLIRAP